MTGGFTKLFSSIVTSSLWQEDDATRLVWIALLALANRTGFVCGSLPGLAHIARVPMTETEVALGRLSSPDPHSRTADHDGKRIEPVEGGWQILNYEKYRESRDPDKRRKQNRESQERYRISHSKPEVSPSKPKTRADAVLISEVITYGTEIGLSNDESSKFFDFYTSNGWKVGRNPMKDWKAALRNWKKNAGSFSGKQKQPDPNQARKDDQYARFMRERAEKKAANVQ